MQTTRAAAVAAVGLFSAAAAPLARTMHRAPHANPSITINDNRRAAGTLENRVLTVSLDARWGDWQPDGPPGPTIATAAFAEAGKPLSTPGPLLRVPVGTEIHATVHNALAKPMWLYGMGAKRGVSDSTKIDAGATRELRFTVSDVGTFYYEARTDTLAINNRLGEDTQLGGAIIVDPVNAKPIANERIFVVTTWLAIDPTTPSGLGPNGSMTFNGRTYPNNDHIELTQGDSVHWRFINLSSFDHPFHLHGFYFAVTSKGDGVRDTTYTPHNGRMGVTEYMLPNQTMSIAWQPDRPGNWVFHCHFAGHIAPREAFNADRTTLGGPNTMTMLMQQGATKDQVGRNHMTGLVLGINVKPRGAMPAPPAPAKTYRILVRSKKNVYGKYIGYAFVLGGSPEEKDANAMPLPGPTLELTRGERVAFTIINQSHEPTAIHWHGLEIESYSDGVPGVSGNPGHVLPPVMPGDSIAVAYTPPRAGTFMYHSHSNEFQQISSGLYGALIVRERGAVADRNERIALLSDNGPTVFLLDVSKYPRILMNGKVQPPAMRVSAGRPIRLRLISIRADLATQVDLLDGDKPYAWRITAKDGMPASGDYAKPRPSSLVIGAGETYDLEVQPKAGLTLQYVMPGLAPGAVPVTKVPIVVR